MNKLERMLLPLAAAAALYATPAHAQQRECSYIAVNQAQKDSLQKAHPGAKVYIQGKDAIPLYCPVPQKPAAKPTSPPKPVAKPHTQVKLTPKVQPKQTIPPFDVGMDITHADNSVTSYVLPAGQSSLIQYTDGDKMSFTTIGSNLRDCTLDGSNERTSGFLADFNTDGVIDGDAELRHRIYNNLETITACAGRTPRPRTVSFEYTGKTPETQDNPSATPTIPYTPTRMPVSRPSRPSTPTEGYFLIGIGGTNANTDVTNDRGDRTFNIGGKGLAAFAQAEWSTPSIAMHANGYSAHIKATQSSPNTDNHSTLSTNYTLAEGGASWTGGADIKAGAAVYVRSENSTTHEVTQQNESQPNLNSDVRVTQNTFGYGGALRLQNLIVSVLATQRTDPADTLSAARGYQANFDYNAGNIIAHLSAGGLKGKYPGNGMTEKPTENFLRANLTYKLTPHFAAYGVFESTNQQTLTKNTSVNGLAGLAYFFR